MNEINQSILMGLVNRALNDPTVSQTPLGKELKTILETKDFQRGQQIADNLCRTYGCSKEAAVQRGREFFNI